MTSILNNQIPNYTNDNRDLTKSMTYEPSMECNKTKDEYQEIKENFGNNKDSSDNGCNGYWISCLLITSFGIVLLFLTIYLLYKQEYL